MNPQPHEMRVQRKQTIFAQQTVYSMRAHDDLAQSLGQELGLGFILLRQMPRPEGGQEKTVSGSNALASLWGAQFKSEPF
jgi:hypothetical protein